MKRRARARYLSLPLSVTLRKLGSELAASYHSTSQCSAALRQSDGKITGHYCGQRWCLVCNRIRTAKAIGRYSPAVTPWVEARAAWFVTLTIPNVPAAELPGAFRDMVRACVHVQDGMRRTDQLPLVAVRKLECTYNVGRDDYHPHFHLVVQGEAAARLLVKRWLEQWPMATAAAQDVRPCQSATSLLELFKYFTKLVTKRQAIPPAALDVIFRAMKGKRVYQPVGFKLPKAAADEEGDIDPMAAVEAPSPRQATWEWSQESTDWVDPETGECLTGYEPEDGFRELVESYQPPVDTLDNVPVQRTDMRERLTTYVQERDKGGVSLPRLVAAAGSDPFTFEGRDADATSAPSVSPAQSSGIRAVLDALDRTSQFCLFGASYAGQDVYPLRR